jgi:hypothetical protein
VAELFKDTKDPMVDELKNMKEYFDSITMIDPITSIDLVDTGISLLIASEIHGGDEDTPTLAQIKEQRLNITQGVVEEINAVELEANSELTDCERANLAFGLISLTDIYTSLTSKDLDLLSSIYLKSHNLPAMIHATNNLMWVCKLKEFEDEVLCSMTYTENITRDEETFKQFQELISDINTTEELEKAMKFVTEHVKIISIVITDKDSRYSPLMLGTPSIIDFDVETV